jgi:hypothetical protein
VHRVAEQRDAADEGRLEASGSIIVGTAIVSQGKVVRPSQLIASVGQTLRGEESCTEQAGDPVGRGASIRSMVA